MRSYSEVFVFTERMVKIMHHAEKLVQLAPQLVPVDRLRCHEVTRYVAYWLEQSWGTATITVDGKYGAVEHSWMIFVDEPGVILDVYAVGRLPQVQLVEARFPMSGRYNLYTVGKKRDDIYQNVIDDLCEAYQQRVNGEER